MIGHRVPIAGPRIVTIALPPSFGRAGAVDAELGGRTGGEAGLVDRSAAPRADAVGARRRPGDGAVEFGEFVCESRSESFGLRPLGGEGLTLGVVLVVVGAARPRRSDVGEPSVGDTRLAEEVRPTFLESRGGRHVVVLAHDSSGRRYCQCRRRSS